LGGDGGFVARNLFRARMVAKYIEKNLYVSGSGGSGMAGEYKYRHWADMQKSKAVNRRGTKISIL